MAVYELGGNTQDGSLGSGGNNYDDGPDFQFKIQEALNVFVAGEDPIVGENNLVGAYMTSERFEDPDNEGHMITAYIQRLYEMWEQWDAIDQVITPQEDIVSLAIARVRSSYAYTSSTFAKTDTLMSWILDWTPPPGSSWANLYQLGLSNNPDIRFEQLMSDRSASGQVFNFYEAGSERFLTDYKAKLAQGKKNLGVMSAMEAELYDYPLSAKTYSTYFIASSGSTHESFKPKLRYHTVTKHNLNHVSGCSVQMTDGTSVVFNWNKTLARYELRYQKITQTSSTLIATGSIGDAYTLFGDIAGLQTVAMCRDDSNNIYVAAASGTTVYGDICYWVAAAFKYNGNYSWTGKAAGTGVEGNNNSFGGANDQDGKVNNVAMVWLPNQQGPSGSTGGTVAILTSRRAGHWALRQQQITTIPAGYLLATAGVARNEKVSSHAPASLQANWRPMNVAGSGMDLLQVGGAASNKLSIGTYYPPIAGSSEPMHAMLTANMGTDGTPTAPGITTYTGNTRRSTLNDPNGKTRTPWMNSNTRYAVINSGKMDIRNVVDDALFRTLDFTTFNITNFPSFEQIQSSSAWDVIWDASRACFWIYYIDSQNPRLLRKVSYDPESNTLDPSLQFTPSNLGPSGSRIVSIRAPRGRIDNRCVLIDVAMIDGTLAPMDLIILRDLSMNHVPNGPLIADITSFNATSNKDIPWFFTDADPNDTASTQDVQVRRVSNGTVVYQPSGVTATLVTAPGNYKFTIPSGSLSNDTQYQIRIRAYDAVGGQGVWSDWVAFTTTATGGNVVITDPPEDNLPMNVSTLHVAWTYSNTNPAIIQNGYQLRRYNNDTNALLYDSGVVSSTATAVDLTGLASGIHHRIEVSVRGTDSNMSGSGIRIVFPDYNNPSVPQILGVADPGAIRILITNPPPSGENPLTVSNQVARKETGQPDTAFVIIGTAGVNGTYTDSSVASGVSYTYRVRGVSGTGATGGWSATVDVVAKLTGMWFSIPEEPSFGQVSFPYGGVGRQESYSLAKTGLQFVGRTYQVVDYGTSKARAIQITTQIPGPAENDNYEQMKSAARHIGEGPVIVLYRDQRGRKMYASVDGFSMTDVEMGSYDVSFTLNQVDFDESVV